MRAHKDPAKRPVPDFDWDALEKAWIAVRTAQEERPPGFTAEEYAAQKGISKSAARNRIRRMLSVGLLRQTGVLTGLNSIGRMCGRTPFYDFARKP